MQQHQGRAGVRPFQAVQMHITGFKVNFSQFHCIPLCGLI